MKIYRALRIAFKPTAGTAVFLGIIAAMALIQFVVIEPQSLSMVIAYVLGYLLFALSLKLILGAVFGIFVKHSGDTLPRGLMLLLAFILSVGAMLLLAPLLSEYAR